MTVPERLFPTLPRRAGESPSSWLSRLASFHVGASAHDFCRLVGLSRAGVCRGEKTALAALAEVGGEPVESLGHDALIRTTRSRYLFRGHALCSRTVIAGPVRFCPACVEEDASDHPHHLGAPWAHRTIWQIRTCRVCSRHRLALTDIDASGARSAMADFPALIGRDPGMISRAPRLATEESPLQTYVEDRLNGARGQPFLDAHELRDAINVTEMIGVVATRGVNVNHEDAASATSEEARAGFTIMNGGPDRLHAFLDRIASDATGRGMKRFAPRATFGALHDFFAKAGPGRSADPSRSVFRDAMFRAFPYDEGTNVGGEPAPAPDGVTLRRAGRTSAAHPKRFRRALEAEGMISPDEARTPNFILLDSAGAEILARDLSSALRFIDLPGYLGCSRSVAKSLLDAGVIAPIGNGRAGLRRSGYRRSEMDMFLRDVATRAEAQAAEVSGWTNLSAVSRQTGVSSGRVIEAVLNGGLADIRAITAKGRRLDALRFRSEAVREALTSPEHPDEICVSSAAAFLRTSPEVVVRLASPDLAPAGLREARRVRWNGGERPVFRRQDLEIFAGRYVFLTDEARILRLFPSEAVRRLDAAHISPAFPAKRVRARIYRREPRFFEAICNA